MPKRKLAALEKVDADLTNLQYKIKRDPQSYERDFSDQYATYENQLEILLQSPSISASGNGGGADTNLISLRDLIDFIAHVAECYPARTAKFSSDLISLLSVHHRELETELREKVVGSLVLLRRKNILDSTTLLNTLFPILVTTPSKTLRATLFQRILADLRNSNANSTHHKLNRAMQKVLGDLLDSDKTSAKGIWAVKLTRELWKRQIWTDTKAVEIMKAAALADNEKVVLGGVRFFLGGDKEREEMEDESSDNEGVDIGKLKHQMLINKKNKKRAKMMETAVSSVKRKEKKKNRPHQLNFSAFHLLHDPQSFAEDLFHKHLQNQARSKLNLEQKLLVLQLVSRLVGLHKLTIMPMYSYFIKYLTPRQPSVTSFLASLAQATHSLVPPDVLEPLVQKIANEFVSEAAATEIASAGLNAIREICARQPLAMTDTLLQDLIMYRKSKDKGVMMAAKGLLSLYRDVGPDMLKKRDRGKDAAMGLRDGTRARQVRFGEEVAGEIEGLDLLEKWKAEERARIREEKGLIKGDGDDDDNSDKDDAEIEEAEEAAGWEVDEEDDSDDSGGWINVESDKEIDISDSDDEDDRRARKDAKRVKLNPQSTSLLEDPKEEPVQTTVQPDPAPTSTSSLATTRILTPADLAKLHELRLSASINSHLPASQRKRALQQSQALSQRHSDDPLTATEIEGLSTIYGTKPRPGAAAAAAAAEADGTDRDGQHKSTAALRHSKKLAEGKSTTNREKARKKNFLMTLGKAKRKDRRSLVERGRVLKAHVQRSKRGGRRGNVGR